MKLLIAIDASSSSDEIISHILKRPWPEDTEVRLLNVIHSKLWPSDFMDVEAFAETQSQAARIFVKSMAERLTAAGIEASGAVIEGYPRTSIVEYARDWKADLLACGSQGHSSLTNLLVGSVASSVIRNAPCSVEVVRPPSPNAGTKSQEGMRILVATDGSSSSAAAVRSIAARPWPQGTEVLVMSVADLTFPETAWFFNQDVLKQVEENLIEIAKEAVKEAKEELNQAGLKTVTAVQRGNPKELILSHAREFGADLVVVGSHGRSGFDRALQGSVSEAVALHAPCSVEVIRE